MNSFGRIFRIHIFGESHGPSVGVTIDGCPPGISLTEEDFSEDLERRKGGMQKGTTPRKEDDIPIFVSGVFNNKTTGAPLTILFDNKNVRSSDYEKQMAIPRPGHADFVAGKKFGGFQDYRGGGHFSGRLTVCLVAAGVVAKKILNLTPNPSPKERGTKDPGYLTNTPAQWNVVKDYLKENRRGATEAEEILWQELRNKKIDGCKFRRQHPVQGYIPDFICLDKKLVVEVDGSYHDTEQQRKLDEERTKFLAANGYREIRFTNDEVLNQLPVVLQKLQEALSFGEGLGEVKEALSLKKTIANNNPSISISNPANEENKATLSEDSKALSFGQGLGEVLIKASIIEIAGEKNIEAGLQKAIDAKDSVGGIIECTVNGLPVGLGEPFFDSIESLLSHAVFAIPAIKGIEFGAGFNAAKMFGSDHNDSIINESGHTATNHAGGIVGGITNGNPVVFRVVVKPTSSTPKEQESWNRESGKVENFSVKGRHDLCIALRVPPVLEAVTAMVILDMMMVYQTLSGRFHG